MKATGAVGHMQCRKADRSEPRPDCVEWHCVSCGLKLAFVGCYGRGLGVLTIRRELRPLGNRHGDIQSYGPTNRNPNHRHDAFEGADTEAGEVYVYCPAHGANGLGQHIRA